MARRTLSARPWVSGYLTHPDFAAGLPAITRVAENGTSANDTPDQISWLRVDGTPCDEAPDLPIWDLYQGQVTVR